jgi:hypothetical protein
MKIHYKIAIPSYKRSDIIKNKTLRLLKKYNISNELITIFVANQDEKLTYQNILKNEYKIVVGVETIGAQRNYIEKYYQEGTYLMMFDDDLDSICIKKNKSLTPINNLESDFIIKGFKLCDKIKAKTFGVYAASNPFFMKKRYYTKLCYIIASAFGVIVEHDNFLERQTNHGEDYEYSIRQYIKNKKVLRFDYITAKSNYFKQKGGLQTIRNKKYIYNSILQIQNMFPQYCEMYIRKSTGNAELRLKHK